MIERAMHQRVAVATLDTDQERVASLAIDNRLGAVPVVDDDQKFIGLVPPHRLLAVLRREHVEDLHRVAGIVHATEAARAAIEGPPDGASDTQTSLALRGLAGSALATLIMAQFESVLQAHIAECRISGVYRGAMIVQTASPTDPRDGGEPAQPIAAAERQRQIAEAAYFRAQQRNFRGGDPTTDWIEAEREFDAAQARVQQRRDDAIVFEKLRQKVGELLAEVKEVANAQTMKQVLDRATDEIKRTGAYTSEHVGRIAASLQKDMTHAALKMGPKWEAFSEKSADLFSVWRDRGSRFLAGTAAGVGEWLQQTSNKLEQQTYLAGEMVYRGSFACTACGEKLNLSSSTHLPPCPKCRAETYHRI